MTYQDDNGGHRAFALPGSRPQYGPDKIVRVERIDLDLSVDIDGERLEGTCTTTVRALDEEVSSLSMDAVDLAITSVERDGKPQKFVRRGGKIEIAFEKPIAPKEQAAFAIRYSASKPRHGLFFIKPSPDEPGKPAHVWTQSQDENARHWFPCLDYPHEKQSTSTRVSVRKGLFALANGELVERKDEGGRTIFTYRQDVPHSTYLMTLVAGPFVEIDQGTAGKNQIPVKFYVLPGREADGHRAFDNTPRMIELFEERTGAPYPYARYSQIAVADFIFGGMENTSATTQTDRTLHDEIAHLDFSSDPLVSHELAHQWFGDLLTCRDWSHAWLNEGFATFFEAVWREHDLGYDEYLYDVFECVAIYLDEDAGRYRRPIVYNEYRDPIELFDRHLYQKGGAVLHMLRGELGEARFWRSIRHYVQANSQRSVETIDLVRAIEEATGRNVRGFFDQWVFRGGHPEIEASYSWDAKRKVATVTIDQKQKIGAKNPPYRFDVEIGFADGENDRRVRTRVEREHETVTVPLDFEPKTVLYDPGAFVLASVTYKLGVDVSAAVLGGKADVVAKIRAARELAKDGSQAARDALRKAFEGETFWGVLAEAAGAIGKTKSPWGRQLLADFAGHAHPKVRRAVASALGSFRGAESASALLPLAKSDKSYLVRGAALASLGRTRDPRAFDVLAAAVNERTWNGMVEAGAVRGLAELADARALPLAIDAAKPDRDEGLRRAAVSAIGRIGELVESSRRAAVQALEERLDDAMFLVQLSAIAATETLADAALLPALDRLSQSAFDGRVRRDAMEAAIRVREAAKVPAQVSAMQTDLDGLREEQRKLQEKIEALSRT